MAGVARYKYETNNGSIFNVIVDDSSGASTFIGSEPSGAYTENMTVRVSKNNKEVGISPRAILLEREINTGAADQNCLIQVASRYKRIPILTETRWDTIALNSTVTIGGQAYTVKKKLQERVV